MQSQLSLQGIGGDFILHPTSAVIDQYYHHQQDFSPVGSAGISPPSDSCGMYPMGLPMQLHQAGGYPQTQSMGMSPMFTTHNVDPCGVHPMRQRDFLRYRRKVDLTRMGYKSHPTAVARRNERERNRVKHINSTFSTLRQHLPSGSKNKKMSKVETLRSAIRYINHLQQILDAQDDHDCKSETDTARSPQSTSTAECPDIDVHDIYEKRNIKIENDSGEELNSSGASVSSFSADNITSSFSSTGCSSSNNSPNSNQVLHPTVLTRVPENCTNTRQRCTSTGNNSHNSATLMSPSSSTKSIDSPINSGYASSDDPGYDTFAATEDDLAELVDWLK